MEACGALVRFPNEFVSVSHSWKLSFLPVRVAAASARLTSDPLLPTRYDVAAMQQYYGVSTTLLMPCHSDS
jgi:hypothetical protein